MFSEISEKLKVSEHIQKPEGSIERFSTSGLEKQGQPDTLQENYENFNPFGAMEFEGMAPHDSEQVELISDTLNGISEIRFPEWEKLSVDQRLNVLNSLEEKIANITKRTPYHVETMALAENMSGVAYPDGRIVLNERLLNDNSKEGLCRVLETFLHEGRHAYQNYNLNVRVVEQNAERVESWRLNCEMGYENGGGDSNDYRMMGFKRYLTQPVEVDARVFAESIMDKMNF